MLTRILSAVVGIPIVIVILFIGGLPLKLFLALVSGVAVLELYNAFEAKKHRPFKIVGVGITLIFVLTRGTNYDTGAFLLLFLSLMGIFTYEVLTRKHTIIDIALTYFPFCYIPTSFILLGDLYQWEAGRLLVWLPILAAWYTDTMAYFVGLSIGKHKLSPEISPKKTVEGAVGGFLGCSVLMILTGLVAKNFGVELPLIHFAIIGLLTGITAQIGDLAASYIKRYFEIKDYGKIIPGHGGILDRFDSIIFTVPTVFFYLQYVVKL